MKKTVKEVFAPVYPLIARQIVDKTAIKHGLCLDVGAGTGHLGIEVAKITNMEVMLMDCSRQMLSIANENIISSALTGQVKTVFGDVCNIPLEDQSVDLVISRGALFFWEDKKKAFNEISRVLTSGGIAYVGGGFGSEDLKNVIDTEMQKRDHAWSKNMKKKGSSD